MRVLQDLEDGEYSDQKLVVSYSRISDNVHLADNNNSHNNTDSNSITGSSSGTNNNQQSVSWQHRIAQRVNNFFFSKSQPNRLNPLGRSRGNGRNISTAPVLPGVESCSMSDSSSLSPTDPTFVTSLQDCSEIVDTVTACALSASLPPRAIGHTWALTFSTMSDGFSLHNLYRKMEDAEDAPVLLAVQDIHERAFGAMLSSPPRISADTFYGTSDTFLWTTQPHFSTYKWSGENFYFIQGHEHFFSVGSDDGRFGIWLDDNLFYGRTERCSTFDSPPLIPENDFKIKNLECWTTV